MDWPMFLVGFLGISALSFIMFVDYRASKRGYEPGRKRTLILPLARPKLDDPDRDDSDSDLPKS